MIDMEEGVDLDENRLAESNAVHETAWSHWKTPKVEPRSESLITTNGQANINNGHLNAHANDYQSDPLDARQGSNELDTLPGTNDENHIMNDDINSGHNEEVASDSDDMGYDPLAETEPAPPSNSDDHVPFQSNDDNELIQQHDDYEDEDEEEDDQKLAITDPSVWTLPANKDICTLEEIRRGQSINKTASNECPVLGCGKKINESRAEPSPGTISSGLRTHVLFVHYANRKPNKKRKLGWSTKRRSQPSPRKQIGQMPAHSSASTSKHDFMDMAQLSASNLTTSSNLLHRVISPATTSPTISGPTLNKKFKQAGRPSQTIQMSSLQSLMQATGSRLSPQPKQKNVDTNTAQKIFNPTTSSLFSILAGLTQQQQQQNTNQQQGATNARNIKSVQGTNTINVSQCSKNSITNNNNNRPANSSLLSLLNEKISGNVANSLQNQLKKTLGADLLTKHPTSAATRQNVPSPANLSLYPYNNNNNINNNGQDLSYTSASSILSSLCSGNSDNRLSYDNSMSLNSFIESIAIKTGSNIGPAGIAEAKKIIEKFTTSLICSSQTIADHYLAPYGGDVAQQKPEIGPSDIVLAYKMMHKSHGQP